MVMGRGNLDVTLIAEIYQILVINRRWVLGDHNASFCENAFIRDRRCEERYGIIVMMNNRLSPGHMEYM